MELEGLAACAIFLLFISPCVWYLWRLTDRYPPVRPYRRKPDQSWIDADNAHLRQFGIQWAPSITEHLRRIETEGVEYYRERFRTAPIGSWHARDNEPMLMAVYCEFRPDHTGEALETAVMGCADRRITFQWREVADFTIELRITARQEHVRTTPEGISIWQDEESDPDDPPEEWERTEYTFTLLDGERPEIAMHTPGFSTFNALCLNSDGPLLLDWP
jgi:hypothetical protein